MIIYSAIDKYKGVHMNASHLAVTGTLSLVPHQIDNSKYHAHDVEYSIEVIHYNITVGALQLFVYLYYYYDKSLNFY